MQDLSVYLFTISFSEEEEHLSRDGEILWL